MIKILKYGEVSSDEIFARATPSVNVESIVAEIIENVKVILERTPPELSADIISKGIYLTGGSANINNICKLITKETGLKVNVAEEPSETVINGIAKILSSPELMKLTYVPREKKYE